MIESIGPIAINIVRVFKDVLTTLITYSLFLLGFTLGFFMILYYYIQSMHNLSEKSPDDDKRYGSIGYGKFKKGALKANPCSSNLPRPFASTPKRFKDH